MFVLERRCRPLHRESVAQVLRDLARLMNAMGESEFVAFRQKAFGEDPPLDLLREAMKQG